MKIVISKDRLINMFSAALHLITIMDYEEAKAGVTALLEPVGYEELPKGHGDLIDRSEICKPTYAEEDNLTGAGMMYDDMECYNEGIDDMYKAILDAVPVIEADKGE